ncbi:hypothetical protein C0J52_06832 [Blattella germanica]|nr:hypothetical protein C0J52_06832 [Blattella germanica]
MYPKVDFRNCECPLVLAGVYQLLIEHCAIAGLKEKRIRFLIEYGAAAISVGQNYLARKLLMEAEELTVAQSEEDDDAQLSNYTRQFNLGKIHILIGKYVI